MTKQERRNYFRIAFGFMIAALGLASITSGLVIAHTEHTAIHWTHIIVGLVLLYIGGRLISPTMTDAIADAILKRLPTVWPGGMRKGDPPPDPTVPLPPSITRPEATTRPPEDR